MEIDRSLMEELEEQVTCWVCFEIFSNPITLPCSHSFCEDCATKVYKKNANCPFCRRPFELPLPQVNKEIEALVAQFLKAKEPPEHKMEDVIQPQNVPILWVPRDVLIEIFSLLPLTSIGRVARVCKQFHKALQEPWLWRTLCLAHYPFCSVDRYGKDWHRCFVARSHIKIGWEGGKAGDFEVISLRSHTNYVNTFRLYRENIVTGSGDNTVKIWKTTSEDVLHTLPGHSGVISDVKFNELRIVSASLDSSVRTWDTRTGLPLNTMRHNGPVNCVQFDDSKIVSGSNDQSIHVWDIRDGSSRMNLQGHSAPVSALEFNQQRIVSLASDAIKVWDVRNGSHSLDLLDPNRGWNSLFSCFTTSGNLVFTGSSNGAFTTFDAATGHTVAFSGAHHTSAINEIRTDGKQVATCSNDGTVKVWDIAKKSLVYTLADHKGPVNTIQFGVNKLVSGSADNSMRVWDLRKGTKMYALLGGSLQKRANNPDHPSKQGITHLQLDESRIVASMASLVKIYDFEMFKPNA